MRNNGATPQRRLRWCADGQVSPRNKAEDLARLSASDLSGGAFRARGGGSAPGLCVGASISRTDAPFGRRRPVVGAVDRIVRLLQAPAVCVSRGYCAPGCAGGGG